jgi:hypothetical protein
MEQNENIKEDKSTPVVDAALSFGQAASQSERL